MEKTILRPNKKHFKRQLVTFIGYIILFLAFCFFSIYERDFTNAVALILFVILVLFGLYLLNYRSKKIVLDVASISYSSLFRKETFQLSEIEFYKWWYIPLFHDMDNIFRLNIFSLINRYLKSYIIIPTKSSGKRRLKCFKSDELTAWLKNNAVETFSKEVQEMQAEAKKSKEAHKKAKAFSMDFGFKVMCLSFVHLLLPVPMWLSFLVGTVALVYFLIRFVKFRGLIRLEYPTPYTTAIGGLFFLLILIEWPFLNNEVQSSPGFSLLQLLIVPSIVMNIGYILFIGLHKFRLKMLILPFLIIFLILGVLSANMNVVLDFSEPEIHLTKIIDKEEKPRSYGNKTDQYVIRLASWPTMPKSSNEISLNLKHFRSLQPSDTVEIYKYQGLFNHPYYKVYKDGEEIVYRYNIFSFVYDRLIK